MKRHKDIVAVQAFGGTPVGFHARNLQVAELSSEVWSDLNSGNRTDAFGELEAWNDFDSQEVKSGTKTFGIRSLTINVTQICNLHCTYCAAGGDGTYGDAIAKISLEKTLPQVMHFLDQVPAGERFHISFLGGEPLLYPTAIAGIGREVLARANERGVNATFKVTTNGTMITPKALAALSEIKADVVVSIDGPAEIHDRQRVTKTGEGSFVMAWDGLQTLLKNRRALGEISVHAVFNEKNLEVEKAWDLFSASSIDFMEFTYTVDGTNAVATDMYNEAIEKVAAKAWARGGEKELLRISNFASLFHRLDRQERLENHCGIGKSLLVVDSRNQLWSCPWTVGRAEDKLGEGLELNTDRLAGYQDSLIERNNCGSCWARFLCGGGCSFVHSSTANASNLEKKSEFCERTRFISALAIVYYHKARTNEVA